MFHSIASAFALAAIVFTFAQTPANAWMLINGGTLSNKTASAQMS